MARLPRLLRREPVLSEAEAELSMERMLARLEGLRTGVAAADDSAADDSAADDSAADDTENAPQADGAPRPPVPIQVVGIADGITVDGMEAAWDAVGPGVIESPTDAPRLRARLVSVMAEPGELDAGGPMWLPDPAHATFTEPGRDRVAAARGDAPEDRPVTTGPVTTRPATAERRPAGRAAVKATAPNMSARKTPPARPKAVAEAPVVAGSGASEGGRTPARAAAPIRLLPAARPSDSSVEVRPHVVRARPEAAKTRRPVAKDRRKVPPASCPYCAQLLDPPPVASRRCTGCRQRIIVRRFEGRAVFLTEAAVPVFEAALRRIAGSGRLARERARWLKLAEAVGAPASRLERLGGATASQESLDAARTVYLATAERAFRAAKRDRRWGDAFTIRRDHAAALYREAGSPKPPPEQILALHRGAALADLRGVAELARDAALVGTGCCDACRVDDGLVARISQELRTPRLPHAGCERGLCRCRWDLAERDRSLAARYLRRRTRG